MKGIALVLFVFTWFTLCAQNGFNKLTADSLKIGEWVYYNEDGKVKTKEFYRIENRRISAGEAFFGKIDLKIDSVRKHERQLWKEDYTYFNDGENIRITRYELGKRTKFYFGENKDLMLLKFDTFLCLRVGSVDTVELRFGKNKSCDIIDFKIVHPNEYSRVETLDTEALWVNYKTPIKLETGFFNYEIFISCNQTQAPFMAKTFGYNLTTDDFIMSDLITLSRKFAYYRNGSETLLKISKKKTSEPVEVITIAQDKRVIDLSNLKSGKYWFCLIDYSNNKRHWKKVRLEK